VGDKITIILPYVKFVAQILAVPCVIHKRTAEETLLHRSLKPGDIGVFILKPLTAVSIESFTEFGPSLGSIKIHCCGFYVGDGIVRSVKKMKSVYGT